MPPFQAAYIETFKSGRLGKLVDEANKRLLKCDLCPRNCKVNRHEGETGICKTGRRASIASYSPHYGEEAPIVGNTGSGTIFFTHCNLGCNFCQNFEISHQDYGIEISSSHLARIMLNLQHTGCHNINFVTPSHVIPQILAALQIAIRHGLEIPLIYNTSAYDNVTSLKLLDGVIDIYMPDFKFWDKTVAEQTCNAPDYPKIARAAILEMHRQVGDLEIVNDIAYRGLLVRHLVLPFKLAGSEKILDFLADQISTNTYLNIMDQYRPCGSSHEVQGLDRGITDREFSASIKYALKKGFTRLDKKTR